MKTEIKSPKIWFEGERLGYTVRAFNDRFMICTKPFNLKQTVLYTIVDLQTGFRGTENTVFCMGFESDKDCQDALFRLHRKESEVSRRNRVMTRVTKIEWPIGMEQPKVWAFKHYTQ